MEITKRLWVGMVLLGALARLLPHPWNFTPIIAIALFAGAHARTALTGIFATIFALALSDALLGFYAVGFYAGFWFVYAAAVIPVMLGRLIRNRTGVGAIAAAAAGSSVSFFLITNFMVCASGLMYPHIMYPRTVAGLSACYGAAIPFYLNQLMGDALYTAAIFGGYTVLSRLFRPEQSAA